MHPVLSVIYTHTHGDRFADVLDIASRADVAAGRVPVIVPGIVLEFAILENVITSTAMIGCSGYMYGTKHARGPR